MMWSTDLASNSTTMVTTVERPDAPVVVGPSVPERQEEDYSRHLYNNTPISLVGGPENGGAFIEYVDRVRPLPFPEGTSIGVGHADLWVGRKLKIKMNETSYWRQARVVLLTEKLTGRHQTSFAERVSAWELQIEFTDTDTKPFAVGDVVEIRGLQGAKHHNGQQGAIVNCDAKAGRFGVKYVDQNGRVQFPGLKPTNIQHLSTYKFFLHRCNVEGGGTVLYFADAAERWCLNHLKIKGWKMLSFEWLEPAVPRVDLSQEPWYISCPLCRDKTTCDDLLEPSHQLVLTAPDVECPVCEEPKECQKLLCGHVLCGHCTSSWRKKPDGSSFFRLEDVRVAEEGHQQCEQTMPDDVDHSLISDSVCLRRQSLFARLAQTAKDDDLDGLVHFKEWLMTTPILKWGILCYMELLIRILGMNAAEVLLDYYQSLRGTDAYKCLVKAVMGEAVHNVNERLGLVGVIPSGGFQLLHDPDHFFDMQMIQHAEKMGAKCKRRLFYRKALRWDRMSLDYARKTNEPAGIATMTNNLAVTLKSVGYYNEAEKLYVRVQQLRAYTTAAVDENLQILRDEIEQWTGNSGKLPRNDVL